MPNDDEKQGFDPEEVSQIDTGCMPDVDLFAVSPKQAEKLSGVELPNALPVWKKLLRLSQSPWGRERRGKGKFLLVQGARVLIAGLAFYEAARAFRRQQQKKKAAGE